MYSSIQIHFLLIMLFFSTGVLHRDAVNWLMRPVDSGPWPPIEDPTPLHPIVPVPMTPITSRENKPTTHFPGPITTRAIMHLVQPVLVVPGHLPVSLLKPGNHPTPNSTRLRLPLPLTLPQYHPSTMAVAALLLWMDPTKRTWSWNYAPPEE